MMQDRVRRTLGGSRSVNRRLVHPAILFAIVLVQVWLLTDGVLILWTPDRWWDAMQLTRWLGNLRLRDLEMLRWATAAFYFVVCALGALLEVRPVRQDPAPWRPLALGAMLLVCAAASVALMMNWPGSTSRQFLARAEADLDHGWDPTPFVFAVAEDLPGARQSCRGRLEDAEPSVRALAAATLFAFGERDLEVRRSLLDGFDDALAILEQAEGPALLAAYHHLDSARHLLQSAGRCPTPGIIRMSFMTDPETIVQWWRENRGRFADEN